MADPLPDDVASLCNHAGFDSSLYKDFTTQRSASAAAVSSSTAADSVPNANTISDDVQSGPAVETTPIAMRRAGRGSKGPPFAGHEIPLPALVERTEFAVVPMG